MTDLHPVHSGDPLRIKASTYNAILAATKAHQQSSLGVGAKGKTLAYPSAVFPTKNISGSDVSRFSILGIDDSLFDPSTDLASFKNTPALQGNTPTSAHAGKFAICLAPIANGEIGKGLLAGVCPVQIDITNSSHEFAEIYDGESTYLVSSPTGSARIIWAQPGTGILWALIRLGDAAGGSGGVDTVQDSESTPNVVTPVDTITIKGGDGITAIVSDEGSDEAKILISSTGGVQVDSGGSSGYLEDLLDGDDKWIEVVKLGDKMVTNHIGPDDALIVHGWYEPQADGDGKPDTSVAMNHRTISVDEMGHTVTIKGTSLPGAITETGDDDDQVSGYYMLILKAGHTDANNKLYLRIVSEGSGDYHINFYKSSSFTSGNLVGHTNTYNASSVASNPDRWVVEDNSSGIGGHIHIDDVVGADSVITVTFPEILYNPG